MTTVINAPRRGRPRAFDRLAALERAMRVFWAAGYEGTSVPMLTDAMAISAQSLYAAFGSKEALYREAIERYRTTIGGFAARALEEEPDALAGIARLLREAGETFARSNDVLGCMITTAPASLTDEPLVLLGRDLRAHGLRLLADRLRRGIDEGQIRRDADPDAWARYVGSIVQGMSVQARDGNVLEDLLSTAAIAEGTIQCLRPPRSGSDVA